MKNNTLRVKLERAQRIQVLEVTIPPSWHDHKTGFFLSFESPGGWILEILPVLRLLHLKRQLRIELIDHPFDAVSKLNLEGLTWTWIEDRLPES